MAAINPYARPILAVLNCLVIWFIVSMILFIISRKTNGGLSAHRKGLKINFIISCAVTGTALTALLTVTALILAFFSNYHSI